MRARTSPSENEPPKSALRLLRFIPVVIVLGLLIHFLLPRVAAIDEALETVRTLAPWALALGLLAEILSYVANGGLLQSVVRLAGQRISLTRASIIEIGAGTVALVAAGPLGFGAAVYRWTRDGGVSSEKALLASWLPQLFDAGTLVVFGLLSAIELLAIHRLERPTIVALAIVVSLLGSAIAAVILLLTRADWMLALARWATGLIRRIRPRYRETKLIEAVERASNTWKTMSRGGWLRPAASSLLTMTLDMACLFCAFLAAGVRIPLPLLVGGYGVPILLGRSSLLPGGIAVIELAMTALYGALGIPSHVAVVAVLTYRLMSFWLPSVVGIPIAITLQARGPQAGIAGSTAQ